MLEARRRTSGASLDRSLPWGGPLALNGEHGVSRSVWPPKAGAETAPFSNSAGHQYHCEAVRELKDCHLCEFPEFLMTRPLPFRFAQIIASLPVRQILSSGHPHVG